MATATNDQSNTSIFSMVDRGKSAWFTWVDIAAMNGGADMTVKIVDIKSGEAGFGRDKSKLAAVFLEGITKPLGCRTKNLKMLYQLFGTDKVAGLRGKLVTLYIGEDRNPRFKPNERDSTEQATCKCVRIRNRKPTAAEQFAVKYDHAAALLALSSAVETAEVEAIRIALSGQRPPAECHAELKAAVASALERIKLAAAEEAARIKAESDAEAQAVTFEAAS